MSMERSVIDYLFKKANKKRIPLFATFEISPICNLSCKMCYVRLSGDQVTAQGGLRSHEQWLQLAREAVKEGMLMVLVTGGEPFAYPGIKELLKGLTELGMLVSINTNGTLIDESIADFLAEYTPNRVNVTLYGASDESYEALTGDPKGFTKVYRGISLLKERKIPMIINASITPANQQDIKALHDIARGFQLELNATTYMFPPLRRSPSSIGRNFRLTPREAAYAHVESEAIRLGRDNFIKSAKEYISFSKVDTSCIIDEGLEKGSIQCRAGRSTLWVTWNGNMQICGMVDKPRVKLFHKPFRECWQELAAVTQRLTYSPECSNCSKKVLCHSCAAMAYCETGDLQGTPKYVCEMTEDKLKAYREKLQEMEAKI